MLKTVQAWDYLFSSSLETFCHGFDLFMLISLQFQDPNLSKKLPQGRLDYMVIIRLSLQEMNCYHCGVFRRLVCLFNWFRS